MDENFQSCLRISIVHQNRRVHNCRRFSNRGLKRNQKRRLFHDLTPNFELFEDLFLKKGPNLKRKKSSTQNWMACLCVIF